jgi:hypothetical protein
MKAKGKELVWLDNVFLFSISYSLPSFSRANFKHIIYGDSPFNLVPSQQIQIN